MMGPATFLMAIMGCGEADAQCQQVRVAPVRYESQAACQAASEDQLARVSDLAFPVVVAECRPATARSASLRADEVRLPEPRRQVRGRVQVAGR
jgi:hypothetical protein